MNVALCATDRPRPPPARNPPPHPRHIPHSTHIASPRLASPLAAKSRGNISQAAIAMTNPHVVFIHLDLGIGGAESLVLNLAKATLPSPSPPPPRRDRKADDGQRAGEPAPISAGTVSIYTTHCSPTHCYDEVKPPDGPLSSFVRVRGSWIPRKLFVVGGTALCSALRMLYLTYRAVSENPSANVFVIDVLPTGVPYLVEYCNVNAGVLFYCHFPDKLLTRDTVNGETDNGDDNTSSSGESALIDFVIVRFVKDLKRIYRWALDAAEEWTMSFSDLIVVNSKFTRGEVEKVFPSLFLRQSSRSGRTGYGERVKVLYPSIESSLSRQRDIRNGESDDLNNDKNASTKESKPGPIVSLNRFERKKNVALLIHAYDLLLERASEGSTMENLPPLIIAGGYDPLNVENVEHLSELRVLADEVLDKYNLPPSNVCPPSKSSPGADGILEGMNGNPSIAFHPSISNAKRTQLLACASVWCYTPHREHFGIVPLEAMDAGVPVVAMRSGGPMETIVDGVTGYLVDHSPPGSDSNGGTAAPKPRENPTIKGFAGAIHKVLSEPSQSRAMGQRGRERVDREFGMDTFRRQWWELLRVAQKRGFDRHCGRCTSYPSLVLSLIRSLGEMFWVVLFALVVTWGLKKFREGDN